MPALASAMLSAPGDGDAQASLADEIRRARRHPISRWYLSPAINVAVLALAHTRLRPLHATLANLSLSIAAALLLAFDMALAPLAAVCAWLAWCCDRLDGPLARRQNRATAAGARLDAQVDELSDMLWHAAAAFSLAMYAERWLAPWWFALFAAGKYLFMYGQGEESPTAEDASADQTSTTWFARLRHLPANADVRLHLLVVCWLFGWLELELLLFAVYYQVRWLARLGRTIRLAA